MKKIIGIFLLLMPFICIKSQPRISNPNPMTLDVNRIQMVMDKINGEGGMSSQYSWVLTGEIPYRPEIFYWPRDRYSSNMLYQIYNPVCLDDNGIKDTTGKVNLIGAFNSAGVVTNTGLTDWGCEVRRYRPPIVTVDGTSTTPEYKWFVDPNLKTDIKIEFEDVCREFGIRTHVEILAFSNSNHGDYFIWKATHKFTGEVTIPSKAAGVSLLPDQTINFYWPLAFSFGPSKAGEQYTMGQYGYEGTDDLDSWFAGKSKYGALGGRDSLFVAYYWDSFDGRGMNYPNGSVDHTGDPDRETGFLHSTQIPGYTLLYADKSASEKTDDKTQPYAITHASINDDFWGRNPMYKLLYTGNWGSAGRGRFPLDVVSSGLLSIPDKGPMRFITVGPYSLTKNTAKKQYDSLTFVYAVGAGDIGYDDADSCGRKWFRGEITDAQKKEWILKGRDSLFQTLDRANWAWNRLSKGLSVPSAPPTPDVAILSGENQITVNWSFPDSSYFKDASTGADDWYAWRVYRKTGAAKVDDPTDKKTGAKWELVFETKNRKITTFIDKNITRYNTYYYAVTAVDDGSQNNNEVDHGEKLESSRYQNASLIPAYGFPTDINDIKPGLPEAYNLNQNYPNPFNPTTTINYSMKNDGNVVLQVYDILGKIVATLVDERVQRGNHAAFFDASKLSSGIYFCKLTTSEYTKVIKMQLIK